MSFKQFFENENKDYFVGVVGYSDKKFDKTKAKELIKEAFDKIDDSKNIKIVSGLTALGIPLLAYEEAVKREWKTIGVACEKAKEFDLFPVDETKIVGKDWGDESETFLKMLDCIIRIGGGKQSMEEVKQAKKMGIKVIEYDLEEEK